jgi:hypothetical protein
MQKNKLNPGELCIKGENLAGKFLKKVDIKYSSGIMSANTVKLIL